ncbi:LON peptidase substrate-binding domain-containing protein [Hyphococcus sp. DH-69]|uniref:LON peptidase substrate-binding domain-containing protein n=1 Tax=Hyphococcus formosus TaxID=3143534 RepID=UPI00398AF40A
MRLEPTPQILPLFPLDGAMLLPGGQLPLNIFEPRYLRMVDDALAGSRLIGMIQPREGTDASRPELYDVGCAGRITSFNETEDGRYIINLTGTRRFKLAEELVSDTPYRLARPDWAAYEIDVLRDNSVDDIDRDDLLEALKLYLDAENMAVEWEKATSAPTEALVVSLAMGCPFASNEKQALLEAETLAEQAQCLKALLAFPGGEDEETPLQ